MKPIQAQKTSAIAGSTCVATTGFEDVLSHLSSPFFHNSGLSLQGSGSKVKWRIWRPSGVPIGMIMPDGPKPSWPLVCGFVVGYFFGGGRIVFFQHGTNHVLMM